MERLKKFGKIIEPYVYLIPAFVLLILFCYYPFVKNGYLSFHIVDKYRNIKEFTFLKNYMRILGDDSFWQAVGNTFIYALVTVPISLVIGYLLACLARKKRRCSVAYEVMFALPMATSDAVIAMIFQLAYNPNIGIINQLFGLKIDWLNDAHYALLSLMLIQIWHNIGYNFLFMLAALRGMSEDVIESARLDGATGWRYHLRIALPLVSPMVFFLLVKDIAYGMIVSNYTLILTGGGPNGATQTIITYIYSKAITSTNYNYAFSATVVGFLISGVLVSLSMILEKRKVHYN